MKDYEAEVRSATDQALFYSRMLGDMDIDGIVDKLIMQGREEVRNIVGYRIEWPDFGSINLHYSYGDRSEVTGNYTHPPKMTYRFNQTTVPPEFYGKFLELGGDTMDNLYVYKEYKHEIKEGEALVEFNWRLRCRFSPEDKQLLKDIGVIRTRRPYMPPLRSDEEYVSCAIAASDGVPL